MDYLIVISMRSVSHTESMNLCVLSVEFRVSDRCSGFKRIYGRNGL